MKALSRLAGTTIVVLLLASMVLVACSQAPTAAPTATKAAAPASAATTAPAAAATATVPATKPNPTATSLPQPTGELRIGLSNFGSGALDPSKGSTVTAKFVSSAIFDSLVGVTGEGQPGPGLAEKWDVSPDAKVWTFTLRKNAKFHDGSPVTSADVKFSLDRVMAADSTSVNSANVRATFDKVEAKDDYTVVLTLKKPDPEIWKWLSVLGGPEGSIVPKKYIEEKGVPYFLEHIIGSGPWKVLKYDNNVELQLEAVDGHWRARPSYKKVTYKNIPEEGTRVAMLKTGELDIIQITPERVSDVKGAGLQIVPIEYATQSGIALYPDIQNASAFPIGDVRVRKALNLAVNRAEIVDKLFYGYGAPTGFVTLPASNMYYDPNVMKPDPYDPTQAKQLLAQAGFANGFKIKIFPGMVQSWASLLAEAVAGYWQKIGVEASLDVRDYAALRPLLGSDMTSPLRGNAVVWPSTANPYYGMRLAFFSTAFHHNHANKELNAAIEKAESTLDMAERKKLAAQAAQIAKQEYSFTGLVDVSELLAVGKNTATWTPIKGFAILGLELEKIQRK